MHYNKLTEVVMKLLNQGHNINSVFDVGANEGKWSKEWKKILPGASFSLFEANPSHKKPGYLNEKDHWFNIALTKPGVSSVSFYRTPGLKHHGTGDSYYVENTPHYKNVTPTVLNATTLDALLEQHNLTPPKLIKLDTQGSEIDIISGAEKTFRDVEVCICEVPIVEYNRGAPSFDKYLETFKSMGFLPNAIDQDHHSHGTLIQIDIVFVRSHLITKII